jgi:Sigma-70 factor, region 1.
MSNRKKKTEYEFQTDGEYCPAELSSNDSPLNDSPLEEEDQEDFLENDVFADYGNVDQDEDKTEEDVSAGKQFDVRRGKQSGNEYDLIRFYLHEIASHSLLAKEEETEMAKEIEKGQKIVGRAILNSSLMLREVINLGEKLRKGMLSIRDVANTFDDESDDAEEEALLRVKHSISAIKKAYHENEGFKEQFRSAPRGDRPVFRQKIKKNNEKILSYLEEINLNPNQMNRIFSIARSYTDRIECIQREFVDIEKHNKAKAAEREK